MSAFADGRGKVGKGGVAALGLAAIYAPIESADLPRREAACQDGDSFMTPSRTLFP